jgi:hypothetical protein
VPERRPRRTREEALHACDRRAHVADPLLAPGLGQVQPVGIGIQRAQRFDVVQRFRVAFESDQRARAQIQSGGARFGGLEQRTQLGDRLLGTAQVEPALDLGGAAAQGLGDRDHHARHSRRSRERSQTGAGVTGG